MKSLDIRITLLWGKDCMMKYRVTPSGIIRFEIKSLIGRVFFNKEPNLFKSSKNILNLGCGKNYEYGYVNADFYSFKNIIIHGSKKLEWYLDLRYPFKCKDSVFDGVFSEHTIEHLYPEQVEYLLRELYRVMKDEAVLRITVPDLEKYVSYYREDINGELQNEFNKRYKTGCEAIRNLTQNYFHLSVWNYEEIAKCLSSVGFKNVEKMEYGESKMPELLLDRSERTWETLYVEAVK